MSLWFSVLDIVFSFALIYIYIYSLSPKPSNCGHVWKLEPPLLSLPAKWGVKHVL